MIAFNWLVNKVLPAKPPTIEVFKNGYRSNETISAKCKSAPGDPKPTLEMFFNGHKVSIFMLFTFIAGSVME